VTPFDSTNSVRIGSDPSGTRYLDGRVDNVGFWKRVLTAQDRTDLYNSGKGLDYSKLTDTLKTNLMAYWNLDEDSGTRKDSAGTNNLTDNNTVTDAPGI
jgi:hypothetical protein